MAEKDTSNLPEKKKRGHNLTGRQKGVKNKTTLFKEAMKEGFEKILEKESKAVFMAVVAKAKEGDMTAAKLILDRVIPVTKAGEGTEGKGATQVVINVSGMEANISVADEGQPADNAVDNAVDAEFVEVEE